MMRVNKILWTETVPVKKEVMTLTVMSITVNNQSDKQLEEMRASGLIYLKLLLNARIQKNVNLENATFPFTVHDVIEENSDESDGEIEYDVSNDDKKCAYCNEIVDHSKANLQNCSKCELNSTCWAEYNKHWNETPDHIFSTAELREIGYKL